MRRANECACEAVTVTPTASCFEVADLLDAEGVGSVVVVDDDGRPVGIVTDRDLVRRVIAADRDPQKLVAQDVMTRDLLLGSRADTISELLDEMRKRRVRRVPLVEGGRLVGLVSLDDLVLELSSQLYNVSESVWVALRETRRSARARRRHEAREDAVDAVRTQLAQLGENALDRSVQKLRDLLDRISPPERP